MKFSAVRLLRLLAAFTFLPCGCRKSSAPPPATEAEATPTPEPSLPPPDLAGDADDRLRRKADKTIKSLNGFLRTQDPKLQAKLEKLTDKIVHDKDNWRKKLQQKRDELQPQIDQLKEKVAQAEGKSKEDVNRQLATLEAQSHNAEQKLTELEGASGDAWKKIKARLKDAEAKGDVTKDAADMPPTPTP